MATPFQIVMETPMSDPSIPKTIAGAKILQALERIEQAQTLLMRAAEDLSGVEGFSSEWTAVMKTNEQTVKVWRKVKVKFDKGRFDLAPSTRANPPVPPQKPAQ